MLTDLEYYQNKLRTYHQWEIEEEWEYDGEGHSCLLWRAKYCVYCGRMKSAQ